MKQVLRQCRTLFVLMAIIFVSIPATFGTVNAQDAMRSTDAQRATSRASVSGDEVCGGDVKHACKLTDISKIFKNAIKIIIGLGLPILIVFITYRFVMAWFSLQQGNAGAYKDALEKSTNAILGFFFIVLLFGGFFFVALKYFGVDSTILNLQIFKTALIDIFVTHAYAQGSTEYLPCMLNSCDIYDFILNSLRLIMRFFIYPALMVIWVWTGFSFVQAQGAPEALMKAKKWFMWAVVTTVVVFTVQMFLIALKGTAERILPGSTGVTAQDQSNANVSCSQINGGTCMINGVAGTCKDWSCDIGGASQSNIACTQSNGSTCMTNGVTGTCKDWSCDIGGASQSNVACTQSNGGTCMASGVTGTCSDWACTLSCVQANGGVCITNGIKGICQDWACK